MSRRLEYEKSGSFEFKNVCPYCNCLNESLSENFIDVVECEDCHQKYYVITEEMVTYNIYKKKAAPVQQTTIA